MIKCVKCGVSVEQKPLHRTTPFGQPPEWTCQDYNPDYEPSEFERDMSRILAEDNR